MIHLYRTASPLGQVSSYRIPPIEVASPGINWDAFLKTQLAQKDSEVRHFSVPGWPGRVWLKRARARRSTFLYGLLNTFATAARLPWLKASPSATGGKESSAVELRRLRELRQAGVRVPHVLAHTDGAILMQDAIVSPEPSHSLLHMLVTRFEAGQANAALGYWRQGLQALSELHSKDQYLSQAFARNIVIGAAGEVGFVDFEDDPLEVMDLVDCKVRDLLCYLHSTAWPIAQAGVVPQAQTILAEWMNQCGEPERQAFLKVTRRLRFLGKLPKQRRFGKDVVRVHYSYALLSRAVG